jgi:hypothetical protein
MSEFYPVTGLPISLARDLLVKPNEDTLAAALQAAYATGYTQAIACCEPDPEWDCYDPHRVEDETS